MSIELNQQNKKIVWEFWQALDIAKAHDLAAVCQSALSADVVWHGFEPVGVLRGIGEFSAEYHTPLMHSFKNLTRETHIFCGGQSNGRVDGDISNDGRWWVSGTGYFHATFANDYLGIPATGEAVRIRWGECCRLEEGKIVDIYFQLDLIDLMQQAGYNVLPPALGKDGVYPPPAALDGVLHHPQDEATTAYSLDHIRRFIFDGLNAYDENALESMGMADYFHPDVKWYGPGGIGACLSFKEFEELHQAPWLVAYPDRQVQNLDALYAEGVYTAAPGWAGVIATHTGPYLDAPATGNTIKFNGLDWWKREGEQYIENWVFVDMVHLFQQFGIDLFARLREQIAERINE